MNQKHLEEPSVETNDADREWFRQRLGDIKEGDPHDWSQLFRRFHDRLCKYVLGKVKDRRNTRLEEGDVDDVVSATFMNAFRGREGIDPHGNPVGWLYTVCLNEIIRLVRWKEVDGRHWDSIDRSGPDRDGRNSGSFAGSIMSSEKHGIDSREDPRFEVLERGLQRLNLLERWLLEQRYIENAANEDLARELGIPVRVFYLRLHRIRVKVRREIELGPE